MASFRSSKFRNVYGTPAKRSECFENVKSANSSADTNIVKANMKFISVVLDTAGGGAFTVLPIERTGRQPQTCPMFTGHQAQIVDTDFCPFNDHIVASASEDNTVMIWAIPEGGLKESTNKPEIVLSGHARRVGQVLFHPTVSALLASSSSDGTVKVWDVERGGLVLNVEGHPDLIQGLSYSWDGSLIATTCRDRSLRVVDIRQQEVAQCATSHESAKTMRVVWAGNSDMIITTGFSKQAVRQVMLWDQRSMTKAIHTENLNASPGFLFPFFDAETSLLFVAGKGDSSIAYYELANNALHPLTEFKSSEPQKGVGFVPKRLCNTDNNEIVRALKVHKASIEPISFTVPRVAAGFQSDLYPDTPGAEPALSAEEFLGGETRPPNLVSMSQGSALQRANTVNSFQFGSRNSLTSSKANLGGSSPILAAKKTQDATIAELQAQKHALEVEVQELRDQLEEMRKENEALKAEPAAPQAMELTAED